LDINQITSKEKLQEVLTPYFSVILSNEEIKGLAAALFPLSNTSVKMTLGNFLKQCIKSKLENKNAGTPWRRSLRKCLLNVKSLASAMQTSQRWSSYERIKNSQQGFSTRDYWMQ